MKKANYPFLYLIYILIIEENICSEIRKVRLERELKIADESGVPVKGAL